MSRVWPALLLAPLLVLADQGVAYAFAGWSCAHQDQVAGHVVHAIFLLGVVASTVLAWTAARTGLEATREEGPFSLHRHDALALCGVAIGMMSAAVVVGMWIPQWLLSPCFG